MNFTKALKMQTLSLIDISVKGKGLERLRKQQRETKLVACSIFLSF